MYYKNTTTVRRTMHHMQKSLVDCQSVSHSSLILVHQYLVSKERTAAGNSPLLSTLPSFYYTNACVSSILVSIYAISAKQTWTKIRFSLNTPYRLTLPLPPSPFEEYYRWLQRILVSHCFVVLLPAWLLACPFCCRSHHSILLDIASWLSSVRLFVCLSGWLVDIFFFVVCGAVQITSQPASHPSIQLVVSQPASQFALCLCHTNFILVWLFGTFSCGFSSGNQQQQQQQ